jgi:small subunit ribosomal protein S13
MPRIAGVDIPADKPIHVALTYIYGIGHHVSGRILEALGIDPMVRAKNLTDDELSKIAGLLDKSHVIEGQLRRHLAQSINRLKDINCYRGLRHRKGLPVRGQRTRSNARSRKGPRKTVAGKKGVKEMRKG